jgi:hypothetical protein
LGARETEGPGSFADIPVKITNKLAKVSTGIATSELGSAFKTEDTIGPGEQRVYEVTVPPGTVSLWARVSGLSDPGADLDLYLIDGADLPGTPAGPPPVEQDRGNKAPPVAPPGCVPRAKAASPGGSAEAEVRNPKPGRWIIIVDGYAVPSGGVRYSYIDFYSHPKFGSLAVDDHPEAREPGAAWTASAHAWAASLPEGPRFLMARFLAACPDLKMSGGSPAVAGAAAFELDFLKPKRPGSEY